MKSYWYSDDLEIRSGPGGEGATVSGPVVKYDDQAHLGQFVEKVSPGAFSWKDVAVTIQHDRHRLIGRSGANLSLTDTDTELRAELRLLETRDSNDARVMIDNGLLRGWSAEFKVIDDNFDGISRTIRSANLHRISLVDQPAYSESVAEIQYRYEQRAAGVRAVYKYGSMETISDTGRNRKRRIKSNAFRNSIDDVEQEITLQLGRDPGKTIASKLAGTLLLDDAEDGLTAVVREAPDTTAYNDFQAQVAAGMQAHLVPQVREVDGAYIDIPEPGNEDVLIREYTSLKLFALSLQLREPKGAESAVEILTEGRSVWASSEIY